MTSYTPAKRTIPPFIIGMVLVALSMPLQLLGQFLGGQSSVGHNDGRGTMEAGLFYSRALHPKFSIRSSVLAAVAFGNSASTRTTDREWMLGVRIAPSLLLDEHYYLRPGLELLRPAREDLALESAMPDRSQVMETNVLLEFGRQLQGIQLGLLVSAPMSPNPAYSSAPLRINASWVIHRPYRTFVKRRSWRKTLLPWEAAGDRPGAP